MTIVTADGPGGCVPDDDYAKLSYYIWCILKNCGVEVLQDTMSDYQNTNQLSQEQKDALFTLASGKQLCIETVSFKTLFLASLMGEEADPSILTQGQDSTEPANTFLSIETAFAEMDTKVDKLLMGPGGVMEVTPIKVMLCNEAWCRTYWVEPVRRIKSRKEQTLAGPREPPYASDEEIQAMFVRSSPQEPDPSELQSAMGNMAANFQKMVAAKRAEKEAQNSFRSFSGAGNSLGSKPTASGTPSDVFDPVSLPDTPPAVNDGEPTTSIAVRLLSGQRRVVKLNLSMTVADLAAHLKDAAGARFRLVAGFPPKPLTDPAATLDQAGLKGAQVSMQKLG